ncbi:MAG: hypothetical protein ABSA69_11305 [Verrucomicrobiota bacterium]|jgi:hypothetical protein
MKNLKFILAIIPTVTIVAISLASRAGDQTKHKPYPPDTRLESSQQHLRPLAGRLLLNGQ